MLDDRTISEIKAKHGPVLRGVELPDGSMLVFRKPTRFEWERFVDSAREGNKTTPTREMAKSCLAYPDEATFTATLDDYPALLTNEVLLAIQEMAGHTEDFPVKKL